jgi:hypothetical protein
VPLGNVSREVPPHFLTRLGDIIFADIYTEVCPKARKAAPGPPWRLFLQAAYIGKYLLLLLEGQLTKLLKHLLFDGHLQHLLTSSHYIVRGLSWCWKPAASRGLTLAERLDAGQAGDGGDHQAGEELHGGYVAVVEGVRSAGQDLEYAEGFAEMAERGS